MTKKGNSKIWSGIEKAFNAKGYDELEVYVEEDRTTEIPVSSNNIESVENVESCGFGIRAIVNGRVGFAFTSSIENILETAECAIANAHISELSLKAFPSNKKIPKIESLFDKRLYDMDIETYVELTHQLISHAKSLDKRIKITDGGISSSVFSTYLMNSNGISFFEEGTDISAGLAAIVGKSNGFWACESRMLDFDIAEIANEASEMALLGVRKKKIDGGSYDVILSPFVFSEIMENLFSIWIDAENVQRGESPLAGKLESMIGPDWLGIVDDGTLKGGLSSAAFDREGVKTQSTKILECGILKNFLYDLVTAQKEGKESTGNAQGAYNQLPSIGPSNLVLKVKNGYEVKDLEKEAGKCLVIEHIMGGELANPATGEFGYPISNAYLYENGERNAVKSGVIVGNLFDLLSSLQLVGKDWMQIDSLITPSVLVRGMKIVV